MHELGIAQNIVDTVLLEMQNRKLPAVSAIALRIGALTDVDPEALVFGFEILSKDTVLRQARLNVERIPVRGVCESCGAPFEVEGYVFVCPGCESRSIKLTSGTELDIAYLEVPD
ncbi:hydrogenase maturation nickel metallochaperone HypA [candidate division GN15 bacterium]|uniref:Hydrogenase maturation factor HypA n=1 Tax=candidate division GN15 bacterium TaxID=2072418 RepID=A0A855XD11_9BACT|nr:MAG: hydrogenase maturation nickel metallochaperone HypA [candidate division GN15 bacterium]